MGRQLRPFITDVAAARALHQGNLHQRKLLPSGWEDYPGVECSEEYVCVPRKGGPEGKPAVWFETLAQLAPLSLLSRAVGVGVGLC